MWTSIPGFALAGFLVGFGTKLGNGCTSGHGLCGLPRLSIRSIVAVFTFLLTGMAFSTYLHHHGLGPLINNKDYVIKSEPNHKFIAEIVGMIGIAFPIIGLLVSKLTNPNSSIIKQFFDQLIVFIVGIIFAIGLMVSGMSRRKNILDFLQIK